MVEINKTIKVCIPNKFIQSVVGQTVSQLGIKKIDLSIALIGEQDIQKLNKIYRNKNKITDILSFNLGSISIKEIDGEIIICYPQVKRQALVKKHSLRKELAILLIHGLLHLVGYDHQSLEDFNKMQKASDNLLNTIIKHCF